MKKARKPRFSARKPRKSRFSPHTARKERRVSPQTQKTFSGLSGREAFDPLPPIEPSRDAVYAGREKNYAVGFAGAPDAFWNRVDEIRAMPTIPAGRKRDLVEGALGELPWKPRSKTSREIASGIWREQVSDDFVDSFIDAVRSRQYPAKRAAQARFLGRHLGADGEVSTRRSRDIVGIERGRTRRETEKPAAEFYIFCCGKKRLTVNGICPECRNNPFPLGMFLP